MARVITQRDRDKNAEWHRRNRERLSAMQKERYNRDPVKRAAQGRKSVLKIKYGITLSDYDALFKKQRGKCAICKQEYGKTLHVDHDHRTGRVRGLLCNRCNMGLGLFQDSARLLTVAINYLRRT